MIVSIAPRLPCPVCLGVRLDKTRLTDRDTALVLDSCRRCGGIWFELGEVQRLRRLKPRMLWDKVELRANASRTPCHSCHALMDRNADVCSSCGWRNVIDCPSCDRPLQAETHAGLRLDICKGCQGVWFDHVELAEIWRLTLNASRQRLAMDRRSPIGGDVAFGAVEALSYSPDLFIYGARTAGMGIEAGAHALANAPEVAAAVFDGVGQAAEAVFHAVLAIIEGISS